MQERPIKTVTFDDVLATKEQRAAVRNEMIARHNCSVVCLSINIPGNVKYSSEIMDLIYGELADLRQLAGSRFAILEERVCHFLAGPTALLAINGDAVELKKLTVTREDGLSYGRLLDIDVYNSLGQQISRQDLGSGPRPCFVCGGPVIDCMRSQRHLSIELNLAVSKLLAAAAVARTRHWPQSVELIGRTATAAMLVEVACTPAPGLVDRHNSGAHDDMDFFSFMLSSSAIAPAMYRCAMAGWQYEGEPEQLLKILRRIGSEAEAAMFSATQGVNTQKGLLFLLGVVTAAAAISLRRANVIRVDDVLTQAASICSGMVERELAVLYKTRPDRKLTAGEKLFLQYGVTGVRGEIEAGLPVVRTKGCTCLQQALSAGLTLNDALVHTLLGLMTAAEDTTVLHRHDQETLLFVKRQAELAMELGGMLTATGRQFISELDNLFIARNISPGGSADLLAVTYFLHSIDGYAT